MIEFIYGFIAGCILLIGIAALDIALFKDKFLMKKVNDFRAYLFFTCTECAMFLLGYLVGV